jgi:uncharacterized OB-fold protein
MANGAQPSIEVLKCQSCGALDPGPREICPTCHDTALVRHEVPGAGALVSWTLIRRPPAAFRDETAYAIAVVRLDSGITVTGRLNAPDEALNPGARVQAVGTHKGVPVFRGA